MPMQKADYLSLRDRYTPEHPKIIFILESPPASGKYFYNPEGDVSEPLFRAMMRDVLEIVPSSKEDGLTKFAAAGFPIIDATYTPVNRLKGKPRDAVICGDFGSLVEDLKRYAEPDTGIVLVKANVCGLLEIKLIQAGFDVLNHGERIPFPASGQQNKFRTAIRRILSL